MYVQRAQMDLSSTLSAVGAAACADSGLAAGHHVEVAAADEVADGAVEVDAAAADVDTGGAVEVDADEEATAEAAVTAVQ